MLLLLAPHPRAHAQEALLVQADDAAAPWVEQVESAVLAELRARGRDVVLVAAERPVDVPSIAPALTAFHDLRPADALSLLDAWAAAAARSGTLSPAERAEGHVWRARVRMALHLDGVTEALDAALRVEPRLRLDEALHPPTLREALAARRPALEVVTATLFAPPGTSLFVDGRPVDSGPLELVVGSHRVFARAPRSEASMQLWQVTTSADTLEVSLLPRAGPLGGRWPESTESWLREVSRRPLVLEVRHGPGGLSLALWDVHAVLHAGPSEDPARLAAGLFLPPLESRAPPPDPLVRSPLEGASQDGLDPWWLVGIGSAALALGALVIGLAVGLSSAAGFDAVGEPVR